MNLVVIVVDDAAVVDIVLVAYFSLVAIAVTIDGDEVSTAYEVDAGVDDDVEVSIRSHVRRGILFVPPLCLKCAAEELFDHGHLLFGGRERSDGNLVAVAHDACGGVNGDGLLVGREGLEGHGPGRGCRCRSSGPCGERVGRSRFVCGGGACGVEELEEVAEVLRLGGCQRCSGGVGVGVGVGVGIGGWYGHFGGNS